MKSRSQHVIGQTIVFTCEKCRSRPLIAGTHLRTNFYDMAFFVGMFQYADLLYAYCHSPPLSITRLNQIQFLIHRRRFWCFFYRRTCQSNRARATQPRQHSPAQNLSRICTESCPVMSPRTWPRICQSRSPLCASFTWPMKRWVPAIDRFKQTRKLPSICSHRPERTWMIPNIRFDRPEWSRVFVWIAPNRPEYLFGSPRTDMNGADNLFGIHPNGPEWSRAFVSHLPEPTRMVPSSWPGRPGLSLVLRGTSSSSRYGTRLAWRLLIFTKRLSTTGHNWSQNWAQLGSRLRAEASEGALMRTRMFTQPPSYWKRVFVKQITTLMDFGELIRNSVWEFLHERSVSGRYQSDELTEDKS